MNISGLSFNALPPIDLPFRFFLSAPIFVLLSVGVIFYSGESLWLSRWQPSMLALTHGFTLGFITMVMMGALLQLLPVIGGIGIAKPRFVASSCHALLSVGTITLMANFLWPQAILFHVSAVLLMCTFILYISALTWVLIKKLSQGHSIIGFRFAVFALFIVVILGGILLSRSQAWFINYELPLLFFSKQLTNSHAIFGLVGWAGLLIIAVSFQVIPMFHVAPSFNTNISRYLPVAIFICLLASLFQEAIALSLMVVLHVIFAFSLLWIIQKRKRKVPDTSIRYWQLSAVSLLILFLFYFFPADYLTKAIAEKKSLILASIFIYFYLISVIQGMLLKILPFLSYTHLQQRCLTNFSAMQFIPHMHEFLNKKHGQWLFYLHIISGASLLVTIIIPSTYWLLSLLLFVEFSWLLFIMIKAVSLYFSVDKKIEQSAVAQP
jgi:hypothetical protein